MFFAFFPIGTDAPINYFPYGTIFLIVANVLCFVFTGLAIDPEKLEPWMLEYGNGLNPFEWLTSMFSHASFGHILGNMVFLWSFGLVVEGKLGFTRFLTLYLGIGLTQSALVDLMTLHRTDDYVLKQALKAKGVESKEQLVNLLKQELMAPDATPDEIEALQAEAEANAEEVLNEVIKIYKGACLGASGAIFGLLGVCLVWAPKNEFNFVGFFWYFIRVKFFAFDFTIMSVALWYFGLDLVGVLIGSFEMGTSSLHVLGALAGFGFGTLYLKKGWVDCERWDLFAVLSGKYGRFADPDWGLGAFGYAKAEYKDIPIPTDNPEAARRGAVSKQATATAGSGKPTDPNAPPKVRLSATMAPIGQMVDEGDFIGASESLFDLRLVDSDSKLDQDRVKRLAVGLVKANAPDEAEMYLEEYIERFPEDSAWAKLRMAHLLLMVRSRPNAALSLLKTLKKTDLPEQLLGQARKLMAECKKQIAEGVEDADQEW